MPHILDVKSGRVEPERCGVCDYCRATKKIDKPIDFEMVGLSNAERKAIFGTL
jgi:glutaredoxin